MNAPTDRELVEAYLEKRQDAAFMQLVQRYQIPVFRHLSLELDDPDDAEYVCETVFTLAGRRLGEWSRSDEFKGWLMALATEVGKSRKGQPIDSDSPRLVDPSVYFRQSVHRALKSLPDEERALLLAVEFEGRTPEELAEERGVPLGRITESLVHARAAFTETLSSPEPARTREQERPIVRVKPGEIIDNRYRVEELLGEGGMATVFKAEHLRIKRPVAVKTLRPSRQAQAMVRERFIREAEVLGRLAHPNFVDVSDFGESSEGFAYLVMELLAGRPLSEALAEARQLAPERALRIVREVSRGLEFAHQQGIIHRDIKPDNIVLLDDEDQPGFAKILDLGVAATEQDDSEGEATLYGTPAYMAPEQVQGGRIDGRVDIYATGIMLFELLTGELPFRGATIQYILVQQLTQSPPPLDEFLDQGLADTLQPLIDKCLAKEPAKRFPSAAALRAEVEAVLGTLGTNDLSSEQLARAGRSSSSAPAPGVQPPHRSSTIRLGGTTIAVLIGFSLLLAASLWLYWR